MNTTNPERFFGLIAAFFGYWLSSILFSFVVGEDVANILGILFGIASYFFFVLEANRTVK